MKKMLLFFLTCLYSFSLQSQSIIKELDKFNLNKIEKKALSSAHKDLKLPNDSNLFSITFFPVITKVDFTKDSHYTESDLLNNLSIYGKPYSFIYNSSTEILYTINYGKRKGTPSFHNPGLPKNESVSIKKIEEFKPKYVMELLLQSEEASDPIFFLYKEDKLYICTKDVESTEIIIYPISEHKDWTWFNPQLRTD